MNIRQKKFKACMICSALNPLKESNIDNEELGMHSGRKRHGREACKNCKSVNSFSGNYKGLIFIANKGGWVEKWQRLYNPGLYAMTVEGAPNKDDVIEYEAEGHTYYDRNESFQI